MIYKQVFKYFAHLEGSQHIASEYALRGLEKIIKSNGVKSVFEFGIGIGTIPYLVKKLDNDTLYVGTEGNEFCIQQFNKNLGPLTTSKFVHLLHESDYQEYDQKFDLVIIDGDFHNIELLKKIVHSNSILFVEGYRMKQNRILMQNFPDALISHCLTNSENQSWSPFYGREDYQGGYHVYRLNRRRLINKLHYVMERAMTAFRVRIRPLIK